MAINYWIASGSNAWGTNGNWSTGATPTNSDDVIITGAKSQESIDGSGPHICPNSIQVAEDWDYAIGDSGTALSFGNTAGNMADLTFMGNAAAYFGIAATFSIANVTVRTNNRTNGAFNIGGAGTVTAAQFLMGHVTVLSSMAALTEAICAYTHAADNDVQLVVQASAAVATLRVFGGRVTASAGFATELFQKGGLVTISAGNVGILNLVGGTLAYQTDGGTITTARIAGNGLLDLSGEGTAKTFTNTVRIFENGRVDTRNGAGAKNLTFSGSPDVAVYGDQARLLQSGSAIEVKHF